jgi:hypothetical protein
MADEAFALSPISARPALPSEQDYDAIREAFMETSRGRWFLGEYAKRNRNADTTMVLDAVTRIEQAMAAQKQEPARNDELLEALAAIRHAIEETAEKASAAFTGLELGEKLAPIHKGARIIKEISWRWREIGADGRICDMIDSQLAAIEASCTQIAESDGSDALVAAFDLLRHRLDELADDGDVEPKVNGKATAQADVMAATAAVVAPAAAPIPEPAEIQRSEAEALAVDQGPAETASAEPELPAGTTAAETAAATEIEPEGTSAQAADAHDLGRADLAQDAADQVAADELAQDEAVLEMVAIEMAAPDESIGDFPPEEVAEARTTLAPVVAAIEASPLAPVSAPRLEVAPLLPPRPEVVAQSPPQILREAAPPVVPERSLGSTLIASGILQRPKAPSDPLAPIRRMSQAEKIAFFS